MKPAAIPIRLMITCAITNVERLNPKIMMLSPV
jgi:hypothetical protein